MTHKCTAGLPASLPTLTTSLSSQTMTTADAKMARKSTTARDLYAKASPLRTLPKNEDEEEEEEEEEECSVWTSGKRKGEVVRSKSAMVAVRTSKCAWLTRFPHFSFGKTRKWR